MIETLTGDVSAATELPRSPDVLAVVRDADSTVGRVAPTADDSARAQHVVTELQRRGAALDHARARREQQLAFQVASLEEFHRPYFERMAQAKASIVEAITALIPQLVFPKKSKTLHTPYGTVQIKESGGGIRKLTDENAVLADALLDRWAVLNLGNAVTVYKKIALTEGELKDLKIQLREDMAEDALAMLPEGLIVERPNATQIKAIAKESGELPDGMETAPEETKTIITFDGMASDAIEAADVALLGDDHE